MSIHHSSGEMDGIAVVYWWGGSSFWLLSYLTQIQWVQQSALILMGCFKVIFKVHLDLRLHHLPVKPMKYIDLDPFTVTGHLFHLTSFVFDWRAILPKLALTSLRNKHHLIEEPISTDTDWKKPTVCSVTLFGVSCWFHRDSVECVRFILRLDSHKRKGWESYCDSPPSAPRTYTLPSSIPE